MGRWFLGLSAAILLAAGAVAADKSPPPVKREHRVRFCGFGGDRAGLEMLSAMWPNLEYCRGFNPADTASTIELSREAKELGVRFGVQASSPIFPAGYLDQHQCWAINFLNRKPPELGMGHPVGDYCHPATVAAFEENLKLALKDMHASSFMMVDFVWPWVGGSWGYSPADVEAYRAALLGTDGGLTVIEREGTKTLSFADYLFELSGVKLSPEDLGYRIWKEYEPVRSHQLGNAPTDEQRRNLFVFRGLYHYCWLRYAQQAGQVVQSLGGELQASLNPENMANGTDLLTWGRLAATGEPWLEEWASPATAIAGYHTFRYFTQPYRTGKKRVGLIGETGAAGGHPESGFGPARPHYWDPNSNYAITWALSAAGRFDDREEDYIYAGPEETTDPAGPQADCWRGYVKGMDGFWQYALDEPRHATAPILSIVNRSILHNSDNSDNSTGQRFSLAPPLDDLHIDFEQAFFPLAKDLLGNRKIVLFAPWEYPRDVTKTLNEWLAKDGSRILVTHSFVPTRPCKGLLLDATAELDEVEAAEAFGLKQLRTTDVHEGKITAIDPAWANVFSLPMGTEIKLERPLVACQGKALVTLGETALVSEISTPRGGRVIYLNFTPPERYQTDGSDSARLLQATLAAIAGQAGVEPLAEGSPAWACARFELSAGYGYFLLDRSRLNASRFTEETPSYDPAARLSLMLEPQKSYWVYDLLSGELGERSTDAQGRLEVFLSGRSVRLLYVMKSESTPRLIFSTCQRGDDKARHRLPARVLAHRPGKAVIVDLPAAARVMIDGKPAPLAEAARPGAAVVDIPRGAHRIDVK